ncbi:MAG: hypothetical protein GXX96_02205 [Planctomycetaceae bacterium]|nr:hypothetical protein [Planctomycetaceae bacterium]
MVTSWLLMTVLTVGAGSDTVVVCPEVFRSAMTPWVTHRESQGRRIAFVSNQGTTDDIRAAIRQAADTDDLRAVLLVGDAEVGVDQDSAVRARCVPVEWARSKVTVKLGSEPHISTDDWCADLDRDGTPEVAVGRLTPDSPEQLAVMVRKIIAYEQSRDYGPWRRRLQFVAGVGDFGALADRVIEGTARTFLTQSIAPAYEVSMIYGSWRSPYFPDPRRFRETTLESLNSGCQFWIYMGHGYHLQLADVVTPSGEFPLFSVVDVARLTCRQGLPIALFLSCYAGAFDAYDDCLAEEMLHCEGGPVAVIAASRVAMPYAMTVMALDLAGQALDGPAETLGEAMLAAKRHLLADGEACGPLREKLDTVAGLISPFPDMLAEERREHTLLFNLLGDPLLRLRRPKSVQLAVAETVAPGETFNVVGSSDVDGRATVELVVSRDRFVATPVRRTEFPESTRDWPELQAEYERANDRRLAWTETEIRDRKLAARLAIPENARGSCFIRVYVEGQQDYAMGAAAISVRPVTLAAKPDSKITR